MRTTLTIDDDVMANLNDEVRRSGKSFKQVVNEMLRQGLAGRRGAKPPKPFKVKVRDLQLRAGISLDNIESLLEQIEGPWHA